MIYNRQVVRFVGLSRSGNHAVIGWVLQQITGRWCFWNCVEPKQSPAASARPMDDGRRVVAADVDPEAEVEGPTVAKDWVLFSQEDTFLGPALGAEATRVQEEAVGRSHARTDVIILRDPFNLMASRRRLGCSAISEVTALRIWKQHARAVLQRRAAGGPVAGILYPLWARDAGYRRAIAAQLGLCGAETTIDRVASCGGGSSFDGLTFDGRASEMPVLDRWRHFAEDASFWALFDPQVRALCDQLFTAPALREPIARARRSELRAAA